MSGKISENDERVARMKEMLSKGGGGMPRIMPTRPKPKPKPRPAAAAVANDQPPEGNSANANSAHSSPSPDRHPDPITIVLNTDSLKDFSEKFEYDFDAVTRHQILDNSALLDRAALSQSKGLQNRRLPSNLASKVPDDYSTRRRAHTYVAPEGNMKRSATQPLSGSFKDEMDGGHMDVVSPELTDEERRQRNLAKLGIQQSNNPLSALGSILKRNSTGRGSLPRKSSKKLFDSPQSSPKTKKKPSVDSPPVAMRFGSEPPESKNPKTGGGIFKGLRRSSSRSKKKNGDDDNRSETGSLLSLPVTLDEQSEEPVEKKPKTSPKKAVTVPSSTPSTVASTASEPTTNGERSPPRQVTTQKVPLREGGSSSAISANRKTTDSAIFKEESFESLFSSDSLFDSSELDKLMGKKKEKTPERSLDDTDGALAVKKEAVSEEKDKGSALKKSVSESAVKSNGYLAGKVLFPVANTDRKRNGESTRRSIKDQLHRYESNSKVSKDEPSSPDTTPEVPAASKSTKQEEDSGEKGKKEINVPTIVEEEEPAQPVEKEALKAAEVSAVKVKDKVKSDEEVPPKREKPAKKVTPGLFDDVTDEDNDLFSKPLSSSKVEGGDREKAKKAALFSDDEDIQEEKAKKPTKVAEKPKDSTEVVADPLGVTTEPKEEKKKASLFDDIDLEEPPLFKVNIRSRRKIGRDEDKEPPAGEEKKEKPLDKTSTAVPKKESGSKDEEELVPPSKDTKKSSLFDDIDMEEPPLFKVNIRSRRRLGRDSPPEENDDNLFGGGKSKQADASEDKPAAPVEVKVESDTSATSVPDKETSNEKETEAEEGNVDAVDSSKKSPAKEPSPKPKKKEAPVKVAPKPAKKPAVATKPAAGSQGKPSWMAELKKRKQEKEGEAPSSPQKKKEDEIPEWRKRALEREKKKEAAKSTLGSKSPASSRKSPLSARKADSEKKSPATTHRRKSPTREVTKPDEEATPKKEEIEEVDGESANASEDIPANVEEKETADSKVVEKKAEKKEEATEVKSPYKTRRQREREAKELEEKEQKEKISDTSTTPVKSTYKTRREREREEREKEGKENLEKSPSTSKTERETKLEQAEERPRYKTRREREREAKEKEEKEVKEKEEKETKEEIEESKEESKKEESEKTSPKEEVNEDSYEARYKARRERAKLREKEQEKSGNESPKKDPNELDSYEARYKARRERAKLREKEQEKSGNKSPKKDPNELDSYEARYKARRERAKLREKEQEKSGNESPKKDVSELDSYEARYKARRERAKLREKEDQEDVSKDKTEEEQQEKEQDGKEEGKGKDESSTSSSTTSMKGSPSRPPLKKKPSIEIISRKLRSGSRSSETEDLKSPTAKSFLTDSKTESDKKQNIDTDDEVFTRDGMKSPSHIEALRTTSPSILVETVVSRAESPKAQHGSEASNDALDVKIDEFEKGNLTSPQNRSAASSPKSSVSSERDLAETRPYRSHTISTSRSPTPPGTGPLKLSDSVPEWKKKLMEKKRASGSSPVHKAPAVKVEKSSNEDKIPPWKKELLAKKKNTSDAKDGPRSSRSVTVSAGVTSSPKTSSRRSKEPAQTPDFMKEFQKKKSRGNQ